LLFYCDRLRGARRRHPELVSGSLVRSFMFIQEMLKRVQHDENVTPVADWLLFAYVVASVLTIRENTDSIECFTVTYYEERGPKDHLLLIEL